MHLHFAHTLPMVFRDFRLLPLPDHGIRPPQQTFKWNGLAGNLTIKQMRI